RRARASRATSTAVLRRAPGLRRRAPRAPHAPSSRTSRTPGPPSTSSPPHRHRSRPSSSSSIETRTSDGMGGRTDRGAARVTHRAPLGAALLLLLCAGLLDAAPQGVVIRVFSLRYRRAEEAALLVRPLLTDEGSVILQPKLNTLTVRDTSAAVERA